MGCNDNRKDNGLLEINLPHPSFVIHHAMVTFRGQLPPLISTARYHKTCVAFCIMAALLSHYLPLVPAFSFWLGLRSWRARSRIARFFWAGAARDIASLLFALSPPRFPPRIDSDVRARQVRAGRVESWLQAHESNFVDANGQPAALWRVHFGQHITPQVYSRACVRACVSA